MHAMVPHPAASDKSKVNEAQLYAVRLKIYFPYAQLQEYAEM